MKKIKEFALVILLLLIVSTLVFVRSTNKNRFSGTVDDIAETLKYEQVFVQTKDLQINDYLVIELGENAGVEIIPAAIKESLEGLTGEDFRKKLEISGKKILLTGNELQAAKAWVILNQLGYKNVFVLTYYENPEVLKYEFQPGTN